MNTKLPNERIDPTTYPLSQVRVKPCLRELSVMSTADVTHQPVGEAYCVAADSVEEIGVLKTCFLIYIIEPWELRQMPSQ
jgi:hypothetical protein